MTPTVSQKSARMAGSKDILFLLKREEFSLEIMSGLQGEFIASGSKRLSLMKQTVLFPKFSFNPVETSIRPKKFHTGNEALQKSVNNTIVNDS